VGGEGAATALDAEGGADLVGLDRDAEIGQGGGHVARIVAEEGTGEERFASGEGGNEQGAVGDALRSWYDDGGVDGTI